MRQVERLQRVQVLQQVRVQRGIVVVVDAVDVQGAGEVEELNIPQVEQEALGFNFTKVVLWCLSTESWNVYQYLRKISQKVKRSSFSPLLHKIFIASK